MFQQLLKQSGLQPDAGQQIALDGFEELLLQLAAAPPSRDWLGRRRLQPVRGLYLWGGVGRGKTWLMDLFYEAVPGQDKQRLHFHRFMQQVHEKLRELQRQKNPMQRIARQLARQHRLICLDEFHVTDIGDAMILANLLRALFDEGVTLVTTANQPPDRLYLGGIQRASFLPAIALLQQHCKVTELPGDLDYRRQVAERTGVYHWPLNEENGALLDHAFHQLATEAIESDGSVQIMSRDIPFRHRAGGLVWFDFEALCGPPRSQRDYIEVARNHHTVIVSDIPRLDGSRDDKGRRFIMLIDEFYDRRVKVLLSADAPPEQLYCGERLAFEFQRTSSRLQAMQTADYLAQPHRG